MPNLSIFESFGVSVWSTNSLITKLCTVKAYWFTFRVKNSSFGGNGCQFRRFWYLTSVVCIKSLKWIENIGCTTCLKNNFMIFKTITVRRVFSESPPYQHLYIHLSLIYKYTNFDLSGNIYSENFSDNQILATLRAKIF